MILAALTLPEVVLLTPLFSTTLQLGLYDTPANSVQTASESIASSLAAEAVS